MSNSTYNEETLPDLLPLYYTRLFPQEDFHKWLCYGDPESFHKREISFTLHGDIYLRYQSFNTLEEFAQALHKRSPVKIDIGAVYKNSLKDNRPGAKQPVEREVVFDIDMTDYDQIRTCCSGADVCTKCWKFMTIACKILDAALREDFAFQHILWVFSGRRGIHCWIADKAARKFDDAQRTVIVEYLTLIEGGISTRKVKLPYHIHPAVQRALKIIDEYFEEAIVVEQDILGTNERVTQFLSSIDEDLRPLFREPMSKVDTSVERWNAFKDTFQTLFKEQKVPTFLRHMVEEIKLYYSYPRLDVKVTKGLNHLLKAPFCVHPKTGKISVPFRIKTVDNFDLDAIPTVSQLLDEINGYDAKAKDQGPTVVGTSEVQAPGYKIKDFKKTSLYKHITIFKEFLRGLQVAATREQTVENGGILIEC